MNGEDLQNRAAVLLTWAVECAAAINAELDSQNDHPAKPRVSVADALVALGEARMEAVYGGDVGAELEQLRGVIDGRIGALEKACLDQAKYTEERLNSHDQRLHRFESRRG